MSAWHTSRATWLFVLVASLFLIISGLPQSTAAPAAPPQALPPHVPGEVLARFVRGASEAAVGTALGELGIREVGRIQQIRVRQLRGLRGQSTEWLLDRLRRHPLVEFAEVNGLYSVSVIPNDPRFPDQWAPKKINAPQAWDITTGVSSGIVAVLDTGVDYNHPDLTTKVLLGPDFSDGDKDPMDDHGHGTRMAGIAAAATNNSTGVAGIDWTAKVLAIKVCTNGWCPWSATASGITYATDNGSRTISISLGGSSASSTIQSALNYAWSKGVVISCAAGNDGSDGPSYPADFAECIKVGATGSDDGRASWSNWGSKLEVMAPGVSILTTTPGGGYTGSTGTSPATPHVAALASLILAVRPGLSNAQVRDIIQKTAKDLGNPGWDPYYGWGRIDAYAAVYAAQGSSPSPTPSPTPTPTPTPAPSPTPTPPPSEPGSDAPPTVTVASPEDGATVSGRVEIRANAADDKGVARVEFYVGSELIATSTTAPYRAMWNTTPRKWAAGSYVITATAVDTANQRTSAKVTVQLRK